jgi:hypothetical protein
MADTINFEMPLAPAVWPFGHGVIMSGISIAPDGLGAMHFKMAPESIRRSPGDPASEEAWADADALPKLVFTFDTPEDADRIAGTFEVLAAQMRHAEVCRVPADVANLVVAAREIWELHGASHDDLDIALEAFSARVPYDNEPEREAEGTDHV